MADDDIVPRLRLWAEGVQNQKAVVLAVAITEAADEIERLREELTASHESHGNEVGALTERLSLAIHERDEARREWCIQSIEAQIGNRAPVEMLAKKLAEDIRGWDCFKEEAKDA